MTAYLILIAFITILLSLDYLEKREGFGSMFLIAVFIAITFTILREDIGYDYLNYKYFSTLDFSQLFQLSLEPGFVGITGFLHLFDADHFWLFCLFGVAIFSFLFRGIKLYTRNVRIAFLIFMLIPGLFLNSLSIIRQSLAIVIMFNAFFYLFEKQYRIFFLLSILAVLFHYSCLLIIPLFFIAQKLSNNARLILIIGIPLSLILAKINITQIILSSILGGTKFGSYANLNDGGSSFIKMLVLNVSVVPYLFFYKRMDKLNRSLLVLVIFGLMLGNIFSSISAITRITYYFKIFEIVLLGNLVSCFKRGASRIIACVCIFVYFFIIFCNSLSFDYNHVKEYPKITPYKSIFSRW